ncbi:MAG TPA: RedB protein [Verrucomicrobiae bacterium]|nr:RedB protein [Verrucomicrobiae bacterium]
MYSLKSLLLVAVGLIWLALVCASFAWLVRYESLPGRTGTAPGSWPEESRIDRATDRPTLLMFAHPRCPCTRASIAELARLTAQCEGRARVIVSFFRPSETGKDWSVTDLWRSASSLPGVTAAWDDDGVEAHRFHSETSGQVLLYDIRGRLVFEGGITSSRGHEGDNAGRSALVAILNGGERDSLRTPVFGCSISDPQMATGAKP